MSKKVPAVLVQGSNSFLFTRFLYFLASIRFQQFLVQGSCSFQFKVPVVSSSGSCSFQFKVPVVSSSRFQQVLVQDSCSVQFKVPVVCSSRLQQVLVQGCSRFQFKVSVVSSSRFLQCVVQGCSRFQFKVSVVSSSRFQQVLVQGSIVNSSSRFLQFLVQGFLIIVLEIAILCYNTIHCDVGYPVPTKRPILIRLSPRFNAKINTTILEKNQHFPRENS